MVALLPYLELRDEFAAPIPQYQQPKRAQASVKIVAKRKQASTRSLTKNQDIKTENRNIHLAASLAGQI